VSQNTQHFHFGEASRFLFIFNPKHDAGVIEVLAKQLHKDARYIRSDGDSLTIRGYKNGFVVSRCCVVFVLQLTNNTAA